MSDDHLPEETDSAKNVSTDVSVSPRVMTHSRELVQYVNRFQTYPSNNSRSLALYIADYYNPQMGYSFPSQEKMASSFSTNTKTIRRWLKEIETTGYWIFRKGGKDNSTRYIPTDKELRAVNRFLAAESRHERTGDSTVRVMPVQARNGNFAKESTSIDEAGLETLSEATEAPESVSKAPTGTVRAVKDSKAVEAPTGDYEALPLPELFPADLPDLYSKMLYNGTFQFKHPAKFKDLTHLQTELVITMVSHLVHSQIIKPASAPKIARIMADIWAAHPETDKDMFYNRTMHYLYKNNIEIASHKPEKT
jgi:hypothetical protein